LDLPVDCIGIDGTETSVESILRHRFSGKELELGLIDARNTALEDPVELATVLTRVAEQCEPDSLWLTPNTGTEYRGFTHGTKKLRLLEEVRRSLDG